MLKQHTLTAYDENMWESYDAAVKCNAIHRTSINVDTEDTNLMFALLNAFCMSNNAVGACVTLCPGLIIDGEFVTLKCIADTKSLHAVFDESENQYEGINLTLDQAEILLCKSMNGGGDCYIVDNPQPSDDLQNEYHHCGTTWETAGDSFHNDQCPYCDQEIEPSRSVDLRSDSTYILS